MLVVLCRLPFRHDTHKPARSILWWACGTFSKPVCCWVTGQSWPVDQLLPLAVSDSATASGTWNKNVKNTTTRYSCSCYVSSAHRGFLQHLPRGSRQNPILKIYVNNKRAFNLKWLRADLYLHTAVDLTGQTEWIKSGFLQALNCSISTTQAPGSVDLMAITGLLQTLLTNTWQILVSGRWNLCTVEKNGELADLTHHCGFFPNYMLLLLTYAHTWCVIVSMFWLRTHHVYQESG